ncbi:MAG: MBL fold metallo-hydrolase [Chlamydiota bacterium]
MTKKTRFTNPHFEKRPLSFKQIVQSMIAERKCPSAVDHFSFPNRLQRLDPEAPTVCWLNHSSFHLNFKEIHLITDPIWSNRCSPIPFIGPKRRHPMSEELQKFSKIHTVLISHNHYDHLDKKTVLRLHRLAPQIRWIVPTGVAEWFRKRNISNVSELARYETYRLTVGNSSLVITAVPAQHFSGRGIRDRNKTHWNGYVVSFSYEKQSKTAYFVGDTGYNRYDFKEIGKQYGPMDLSLIPIGAYHPRFLMREIHVNPEEAVFIHREVRSKFSIGMHWKTFKLTGEKMDRPPYDLYLYLKKYNISADDFRLLDIGQTVQW